MGRSDSKNANLKNDFLGEKELTPSAKPNSFSNSLIMRFLFLADK